jgi:hypothetical protein
VFVYSNYKKNHIQEKEELFLCNGPYIFPNAESEKFRYFFSIQPFDSTRENKGMFS